MSYLYCLSRPPKKGHIQEEGTIEGTVLWEFENGNKNTVFRAYHQ